MNVTTTKVCNAVTKEVLESAPRRNGFIIIGDALENSDWIEVCDARSLIERVNNPLRGAGVKRYLGDTHKIVTKKYFEKFVSTTAKP